MNREALEQVSSKIIVKLSNLLYHFFTATTIRDNLDVENPRRNPPLLATNAYLKTFLSVYQAIARVFMWEISSMATEILLTRLAHFLV